LEERLAESTRGQGALQQRLTQLQRQRERAEDAAAICERELVRVYGALAESFREKVAAPLPANWLATCFPTGPELTAFDAELESRKREDAQLERQLGELGRQRTVDQQEEQRLRRDLERTQERLAELQRHQAVQEALRASAQEALMTARCDVPPAWDSELRSLSRPRVEALQEELADLRRQDLGTRLRDLERAQNDLDRLQARQQELAHRQAAIPEPARREPEDVARRLAIARQQEKQCQSRLLQARHEEQRLEERRNARAALEETRSNVLKEHGQYSLLAKYLDRDWLQRHLMRQAEQTIVAYARDILDRLSGGQLALQQRAEEGGDKALVLEVVNRAATEASPHRVDMLSGSERFRAAVSLALAIGQFASRQHRPIQSVIIDEGFGCLDPANRQLMIQELHNLQGQLQRILLVSHQEEFADAFTNGYRFELDHGATRVTRFAG
jgi:DNA repair exonuclease SbcCD ATPase subunit